ncbi:LacI family DNA-binding transcriptional regulator [Sphingorhabdus arenilitoris]|uniref:LacI family DNA-binding transcriptional regulator n=1 Tax=Sphingorhabdus arenilitoris TaxID=1490041 RepID=A0ABV8RE01_9SPHN
MRKRRTLKQQGGPRHGRLTIDDVAREAGFSPMTVSRVINADSNVKAATREHIQKVIAEMGYSPNAAARSLAGGRERRIALIYQNPSAAYLSRVLFGSLERARNLHAQLVVEDCGSGRDAKKAIDGLFASGVEGVILTPPLSDDEKLLRHLMKNKHPFAVVANWNPEGEMSVVYIDDRSAARRITEYLLSLGHRHIAMIEGPEGQKASSERRAGYGDALNAAGIEIDPSLIEAGAFTFRSGMVAAEKLMALPHPPTAIFAANDDMGAGAITALHRINLNVPDDVSVCGFDDSDFAKSIWPELTTMHQPISDMAAEAVEQLVTGLKSYSKINGWPRGETEMAVKLVKRASTAKLKRQK